VAIEGKKAHFIDQLRDYEEQKKEVVSLRTEMDKLQDQLTELTSAVDLGARDIATNFEKQLMTFIWSEYRSRPFHIYFLKNLKEFLFNPQAAYDTSCCGPLAAKLFSDKPKEQQRSHPRAYANY
jgi:hypothetical protein